MACTYVLFSKTSNRFYVGSSRQKAEERIVEHNAGKTRSTKSGKPWILVWEEPHDTYTEARKRENFLKSGVGRKWIYEKFSSLKNT